MNPGYAALVLNGTMLYGTTHKGGSGPDLIGDGRGPGVIFALDVRPTLDSIKLGDQLALSWADSGFALQSAPVSRVYTNIPGATSPYTKSITAGQQYFRLIGN